jgi:hypothetical protein
MSNALLLGSIWIILLLGLFLALPRLIPRRSTTSLRFGWLVVILIALIARLVPNILLPMGASFDIESYQIVSNLVLRGEDVYSSSESENRHPYLPLQMYWMAMARMSSDIFHVQFVKTVRLAPILADVAIALLIYLNLRDHSMDFAPLLGGLLYALNPLTVYVSAYHGQFDAIPALLILLALQQLARSPAKAGGWLGLGILIKSWPVLALPSMLAGVIGVKNKIALLATASLTILTGIGLYILLFDANPIDLLTRSLGYNHGIGVWGYSYLIKLLSHFDPAYPGIHLLIRYGRFITLTGLGLIFWFKARHESPRAGILTILLAFIAITHAFSIQYLMWIVPFAILEQEHRWLNRYTIAAFAYMFLAYTTLILEFHITNWLPWPQADWLIIIPASIPVWLITIGWLVRRLRTTDTNCPAGIA